MKTLTVEEATPGLGRLVELALAGEQIQIRQGNGIVELRPAQAALPAVDEKLTPREALRRLQEDAQLTPRLVWNGDKLHAFNSKMSQI